MGKAIPLLPRPRAAAPNSSTCDGRRLLLSPPPELRHPPRIRRAHGAGRSLPPLLFLAAPLPPPLPPPMVAAHAVLDARSRRHSASHSRTLAAHRLSGGSRVPPPPAAHSERPHVTRRQISAARRSGANSTRRASSRCPASGSLRSVTAEAARRRESILAWGGMRRGRLIAHGADEEARRAGGS
ncbi:hypothetical protein QYE76_045864 [Lolium multiflorum]|uniref:Uncharacterized protein n=1 Tax=Lolium multiflorum TaxID=4521 RepID=A0AAD8TNV0_LOLMU|nr:hypothetical protein QYE76_045864 [Lolium multiflorum]